MSRVWENVFGAPAAPIRRGVMYWQRAIYLLPRFPNGLCKEERGEVACRRRRRRRRKRGYPREQLWLFVHLLAQSDWEIKKQIMKLRNAGFEEMPWGMQRASNTLLGGAGGRRRRKRVWGGSKDRDSWPESHEPQKNKWRAWPLYSVVVNNRVKREKKEHPNWDQNLCEHGEAVMP